MADLAETDQAAHRLDHVMRSFSSRLVDNQDSVEGEGLWGSRHEIDFAATPGCCRHLWGSQVGAALEGGATAFPSDSLCAANRQCAARIPPTGREGKEHQARAAGESARPIHGEHTVMRP